MYHGKDIGNRDMNILSRTGFGTNAHGGTVKERPNIVGLLNASFSVPNNVVMLARKVAHKVEPLMLPIPIS